MTRAWVWAKLGRYWIASIESWLWPETVRRLAVICAGRSQRAFCLQAADESSSGFLRLVRLIRSAQKMAMKLVAEKVSDPIAKD